MRPKKFISVFCILAIFVFGTLIAAYLEKSNFSDKTFTTITDRSDTGGWKYIYDYSDVELAQEWVGSASFTVGIKIQGQINSDFYTVTSGLFSYTSNTVTGVNSGTWTHQRQDGDTAEIYTDMSGFGYVLKDSDSSSITGCRAVRVIYDLYPYRSSDSSAPNLYNSFFIMRK